LADYLDSISDEDLISVLKCLERILGVNLQNDRIVIPALETIAGLFEENIFARIEHNYKYDCPYLFANEDFDLYLFLLRKLGLNPGM
jgi:hypothetical protein